MPKLLVLSKGKPREIEMGQELTIGRGYSNLLRLEGEEISRVHAIIYRRDTDFILRDLDSKNGVFLNGNKIASAELGPGDRLQVGKYRMIFNPPPDFNWECLAENSSATSTSPAYGSSNRGIDASDSDYSHSHLFSAAGPEKEPESARPILPEPVNREEVTLLTRAELDEDLRQNSGIFSAPSDGSADFFDAFSRGFSANTGTEENFTSSVLGALVLALSADRGVVILRDSATGVLSPAAIVPRDSDVSVNRVVLRSGFSEEKAILCPATSECGLFRDSSTVARENITTLMSVPLGAAEPRGLIYVDRQGDAEAFELVHLATMIRVARLLEMHIRDISGDVVPER